MGNLPRMDIETELGIVTDVCLKRKIRNYVEFVNEYGEGYGEGHDIFIRSRAVLERQSKDALKALGIPEDTFKTKESVNKYKKKHPEMDIDIIDYLCKKYYDIRTFGAVLATFNKGNALCGQVRGPVQLGFSRSIDPIEPQTIQIDRVAVQTEAASEEKKSTFGRKEIVPYGLYRVEGYVSAALADKTTGFSEDDLELLWEAILNMFEHDRSAARGNMAVRALIIFKHDSILGNAPAHKLFELLKIEKKEADKLPRKYSDYNVSLKTSGVPEGVEVIIPEGKNDINIK